MRQVNCSDCIFCANGRIVGTWNTVGGFLSLECTHCSAEGEFSRFKRTSHPQNIYDKGYSQGYADAIKRREKECGTEQNLESN